MKDQSFGIVPLRQQSDGSWQVFIIQHRAGHWSLPKGHPELMETPLETAKRELFEETHLTVKKLLMDEPLYERYSFKQEGVLIDKTVGYFIAEVSGQFEIDTEELQNGNWEFLPNAMKKLTYPQARSIVEKTERLLTTFGPSK